MFCSVSFFKAKQKKMETLTKLGKNAVVVITETVKNNQIKCKNNKSFVFAFEIVFTFW